MATAMLQPWRDTEPYRINLFSSPDEIQGLSVHAANFLPEAERNANPGFFLASITGEWKPRVAVVRQRRNIIGIVYGKERRFAGIDTGIVYVDATLSAPPLGTPHVRERVFHSSARAFLSQPGVRALRFAVSPSGPEFSGLQAFAAEEKLEIASMPVENHTTLRLPLDYDAFLQQLRPQRSPEFSR